MTKMSKVRQAEVGFLQAKDAFISTYETKLACEAALAADRIRSEVDGLPRANGHVQERVAQHERADFLAQLAMMGAGLSLTYALEKQRRHRNLKARIRRGAKRYA